MKTKHVILRAPRASTRDLFLGPLAAPLGGPREVEAPTAVKLDIDELDRRDVGKVARDSDVVAIAPAMPMKLVEPLDIAAAQPSANKVEWGIQAVNAHSSPFDGNGVVVAVLDTGIDPDHPAFAGVNLNLKNFTSEADAKDNHGHGTHCAGTIFGRDTNGTRIGIARGVKKALIGKVLGAGGGGSDQVASAIQWAMDNGANVVSMSLGIDFPGFQAELEAQGIPKQAATSIALEGYRQNVQLFERLAGFIRAAGSFRQPMLLIAAAGNESRRTSTPSYEISVSPPAVSEGIISVAALGQGQGGLESASFSNTGANISGPGVGIVSAKPGGGLQSMNGTSMAAPHVAGLAALWAQKIKETRPLKASEWLSRLIGSGISTTLKAGFDPADVGSGLAQAPQA